MLIIVTIALAILFVGVPNYIYDKRPKYSRFWSNMGFIGSITGGILAVAIIIMGLASMIENICGPAYKIELEETYNHIVYQLNHDYYDNMLDFNKKELMDDILKYNKSVATGKKLQHDFWFGLFYADIYDDLEVIDLEEVKNDG